MCVYALKYTYVSTQTHTHIYVNTHTYAHIHTYSHIPYVYNFFLLGQSVYLQRNLPITLLGGQTLGYQYSWGRE